MREGVAAVSVGLPMLLSAILTVETSVGIASEDRAVYIAPNGKPSASGAKDSPIDIATAFSDGNVIRPGTVVWIGAGTYSIGDLQIGPAIQGREERPIIYRAIPGERATLVGEVRIKNDYVWLWGLDLKGGVITFGGDGLKLINMTIHEAGPPTKPSKEGPSGQGIGGWDVGNDHEFYGNLIYHNGWNHFDHGIYSQNTASHTVKRYIDNIVFENAGTGFHLYGQAPVLSGFHLEGNICFATSLMPRNPRDGEQNIIVGGSKPLSNVVLKNNCTYHPQRNSKRGVEIGYHSSPNTGIVIEDNYFMGGAHAMEMNGVAEAVVRNNTFWAPEGMVRVNVPEGGQAKLRFEGNRYLFNGKFDFRRLFAQTRSTTDVVVPTRFGRPSGLHLFTRVNHYEAQRVHLAVYNWDRKPAVTIVLKGILKAGDSYRVVNVLDFYGAPVVEGKARGAFFRVPMRGHRYEPEFGAYILFRDSAEDGERQADRH